MTRLYIGLGSNRGQSFKKLKTAKAELAKIPSCYLSGFSPIYQTEPLGCPGKQRYYFNAVAELQSIRSPKQLHASIRRIELKIQKKIRKKNAPRYLDLDYLYHGNAVIKHRLLQIPHPRINKRAFVLQPLADILKHRPTQFVRYKAILKARKQWTDQNLLIVNSHCAVY